VKGVAENIPFDGRRADTSSFLLIRFLGTLPPLVLLIKAQREGEEAMGSGGKKLSRTLRHWGVIGWAVSWSNFDFKSGVLHEKH
jgi:hypothetical protein